ncbi:unnamed protein product [Medioppia subpectinata]|uniref:Cytochrome P450 n=1 Tax=Medioppia subpectinata TaxID=1979941 RepID=A0A7R9KDB9_9ACAR|nr:unnamed protein product [Medioppia subpectinata]CAG2101406.1 unnamed protein product [Medioppia subpectinata]
MQTTRQLRLCVTGFGPAPPSTICVSAAHNHPPLMAPRRRRAGQSQRWPPSSNLHRSRLNATDTTSRGLRRDQMTGCRDAARLKTEGLVRHKDTRRTASRTSGSRVAYLKHRYTYWARHGVKGPNYVSVRALRQKFVNISLEKNRKYGRIYGSYMFTNKWLTINEPELIRDIAVKDFHIFPNKYDMNYGKTYITSSLFLMKGDHNWRRVRSVVTPAFTTGKLISMMASIEGIADQFVVTLDTFAKNGETVDMRKYFSAFAMDVISACAYGINVESINNPNHPIVVNAKKILSVNSNLSYAVSVLLPPIARLLRLEPFDTKAIKFLDLLVKDIVNERKISTNEGKKSSDFLQLMIDSEKNDRDFDLDNNNEKHIQKSGGNLNKNTVKALSKTELTAQGFTFFIAGYDTTSASLSHVVYYLSQNKDKQQILREELNALDTDFTYENLNQCQYLNAVIDETLRLAPPLGTIQRECIRDYKLGNTG